MEYEEILDVLAPCGLNCRKCFAYSSGETRFHSIKLRESLGNFDSYAQRFLELIHPVFEVYPYFKSMLTYFSEGDCKGCRNGTCKYLDCGVFVCYRKKGVDFCFQCDEFPCKKTNFDPDLERRWIQMSTRMKEIGVELFLKETKDLSRYR